MQSLGSNQVLLIILALFFIYIVAAMFAAQGWVIYRLVTRRPVLPVRPLVSRRELPWGIWTVLFTIVIFVCVNYACLFGYAYLTGRFPVKSVTPSPAARASKPDIKSSPPTQIAKAEAKPADPNVKPLKPKPTEKSKPASTDAKDHAVAVSDAKSTAGDLELSFTEKMAVGAVIDVLLLFLLPLLLRVTSSTPLRDLGLSFKRWWLQSAVGVVALLAVAPIVYGVQYGMARVWESRTHPLQKMVLNEFSPGVAQLAILTAVIVAPLFEEIMFRGILQSWLVSLGSRRRPESNAVLVESLAIDSIEGSMPIAPWTSESGQWKTDGLEARIPEPAAPAPKVPPERLRSGLAGIVLTSLIFAGVHSPQWPAPFAIFVLSVAIGIVYHRTGSLIAAVCMHATLNGLTTLVLLGSLLAPQPAQHPKAPVVDAPAPVASFYTTNESACIYRGK